MAEAYRITEQDQAHFMTCTAVAWIDVFTRPALADTVLESLAYCIRSKGLRLHAWCLMSNHLHLIASAKAGARLSDIMRDFKKFTAKALYKQLADLSVPESRREWMMRAFRQAAAANPDNEQIQVWQEGFHPVLLDRRDRAEQRLNYLHDNPVRAGLVRQPWEYRYSSAIDYMQRQKGLLDIELL